MNYRTLIILFSITITSCASNCNTINNLDDYLILEVIKSYKLIDSFNTKAFLNNNPRSFFGKYNYWKDADEKTKNLGISLSGKVEWIFSKDDIIYMSEKYNQWSKINWNERICNKIDVNLSDKSNKIITYPFYNKSKNKAMISLSHTGSGTKILLLKKDKNTWVIVGELTHNFGH